MPVYQLTFTRAEGVTANTAEFDNDATAIDVVGGVLDGQDVVGVTISRGEQFLGAWDWNEGSPRWTGES